jgi:PhnB protein
MTSSSTQKKEHELMQRITPYLFYEDVEAALEFLARAFGFQETLRYNGPEGYIRHAETRLGDGTIMLGDPGEQYRNPRRTGVVSVAVHVTVADVQATFERAEGASAQIIEPPADQPYGGRRFGASDPEGHQWWFSQKTPSLAAEDWSIVPTIHQGRDTKSSDNDER